MGLLLLNRVWRSAISLHRRNIKNYHLQTKDALSMIYSLPGFGFDAEVVNGNHELPDLKSNAESVRFRNEGNTEYFASFSDFEVVLYSYTKSVAYAVEGSTEQMLALDGNRSAVLLRLRRYIPCLLDVNRVLKMNCFEELKEKILERKKRCLSQINDTSVDAEATDPVKGMSDREEDAEWANICKFDNLLIPNASLKLKNRIQQKVGKAFDRDGGYQSGECRLSVYNSYHRVECRLNLDHRNNLELMGTEQGAQLRNLMRKLPKRDLFRPNTDLSNKPFVNGYLATLNLSRTYNPDVGSFFIIFVGSMINSLNDVGFFKNKPRT